LSTDVNIANGVARLTTTYFAVSAARVESRYKPENAQVRLHGNLWTEASLSDHATGIKALLFEPLDPLFQHKYAGAMVGVSMGGHARGSDWNARRSGNQKRTIETRKSRFAV